MPSRRAEEGFQFPLPIGIETTSPVNQRLAAERRRKKIGLLIRILHDKDDGDLYEIIKRIEANFKAGGSRTEMIFYNTKQDGRKTVEVTPEEIDTVLDRRHARQKVA